MDRLPPEAQEQLKKMSTARVMLKLGKAGYDDDRLEELDRAELLENLAETIIAQSDTHRQIWPGRPRRRPRSLSRQGILAVLPPKSGARLCDSGSWS